MLLKVHNHVVYLIEESQETVCPHLWLCKIIHTHVPLVDSHHIELVTLWKVGIKRSSHECDREPHKKIGHSLLTACWSQIVKFIFRGEVIITSLCFFSLPRIRQTKGEIVVQFDFKIKYDFYEDSRALEHGISVPTSDIYLWRSCL